MTFVAQRFNMMMQHGGVGQKTFVPKITILATFGSKGGVKKNLTKLARQFLLTFSGYKHDRQLEHNSFEK